MVAQQVLQEGVVLGGELQQVGAAPYFAAGGVELQGGEGEDGRGYRLGTRPQRFRARQQLLESERLGDVVVGAGAQHLDFGVDALLRREHEYRLGEAAVAQGAQDFQSADLRQPEVEHDEVVVALCRVAPPLFAVGRQIRRVAPLREAPLYVLADRPVVLDDENLHPTGRYTLKSLPTPTCDSTSIRPR